LTVVGSVTVTTPVPVKLVNLPTVVYKPEKNIAGNFRVIRVGFGAVPNGAMLAGRAFEPVFVIAVKKADDDIPIYIVFYVTEPSARGL
jgi:hypothetical protein